MDPSTEEQQGPLQSTFMFSYSYQVSPGSSWIGMKWTAESLDINYEY